MALFTIFSNPKDHDADEWNAFVLAAGGIDNACELLTEQTEYAIVTPEMLESYFTGQGFKYWADEVGISERKLAGDLEDAYDNSIDNLDANLDEVIELWRQDNITESVQNAIWEWVNDGSMDIGALINSWRLDGYDTHETDSLFWAYFREFYE